MKFNLRSISPLCKSLALVLPLLALAVEHADAQLSRYLVLFTSAINTGQYAGDRDIAAAAFSSDGALDWTPDQPKAISAAAYREFSPVAIPDGEGGAFVAYTIEHADSLHRGDRDILMRHVDRMGMDLWGDSTSRIIPIARTKYAEQNPTLVRLTDGSMMIFYEIHYTHGDSGDVDVAAIRIARDGSMLWPKPIWVANGNRQRELVSAAVTDGIGGAIAVLEVTVPGDSTQAGDIVAAHVDVSGMVGYKDSKLPVNVAVSRHDERNPSVVADGVGGAYIAYEVRYIEGVRAGDVDILAQHLTPAGTREWQDGANLPFVSSVEKAHETSPSISLDSNGIIVAFEINFKGERRPRYLIGLQRMDMTGRPVWNAGRKPVTVGLTGRVVRAPQLVADTTGGAFLLFESTDTSNGNRDVHAQRYDRAGSPLWGENGTPVAIFNSPDPERDAQAVYDGNGNLVVVAVRDYPATDGMSNSNVVAERVALDGTHPWATLFSPLLLTNSPNRAERPTVVLSR